jgi:VWFA-related protein
MRKTCKTIALIALAALTLGVSADRVPPDNPGRLVTFDVAVTDKNNNPVAGLQRKDFRVFEDGVAQTLTRFRVNREPLAIVVLVDFSSTFDYYRSDAIELASELIRNLRPEDWGAVVSFEVMPEIVTDFTHDKSALIGDLRGLQMPYFREAALSDAVYFVLDRMKGLEEKSAVLLLGTGLDTMSSKRSMVDALKKAESSDTTIYTVSFAESTLLPIMENYPDPGARFRLSEAQNTLAAFAEASGGLSFTPMFPGQFRHISEVVNADLRNQYTLSFVSDSTKDVGKLRKLKVEVSATDLDQNGKPDKLRIRHKRGY